MNTLKNIFSPNRIDLAHNWVRKTLGNLDFTLSELAADAGLRRYFRIATSGEESFVLMDAPVEHNDLKSFCEISELMTACKLNVPTVIRSSFDEGFLLLSDLGDDTYLSILNNDNADELFDDATTALTNWQAHTRPGKLKSYNKKLITDELELFEQWFLDRHLGLTLHKKIKENLKSTLTLIASRCDSLPKVFAHRDFMPRNLMVCPKNPGILDFQDAMLGPITYDPISLFKDAFISWDEERVIDWLVRYWEKARKNSLPVRDDFGLFFEETEWTGLQRHLKVLGVFSRLKYRDSKPDYIIDAPRFLSYIRPVAERYDKLRPILEVLDVAQHHESRHGYTF